jgi:hypothetical protein
MHTIKVFKLAAVTLMCTAALFHSSCNKNSKGSYTVTGKIMDSCLAGKPFANQDLILSIRVTMPAFQRETHDKIGEGKTDANGNYSIVCQNWGRGEIFIKSKNLTYLISKYIGNSQTTKKSMEGNTYELETECLHE